MTFSVTDMSAMRPSACRSSGMRATPSPGQMAGVQPAHPRRKLERAATRASEAAQEIGERGLAVAGNTGEAEDLAAMQREVGAIEPVRR